MFYSIIICVFVVCVDVCIVLLFTQVDTMLMQGFGEDIRAILKSAISKPSNQDAAPDLLATGMSHITFN